MGIPLPIYEIRRWRPYNGDVIYVEYVWLGCMHFFFFNFLFTEQKYTFASLLS